MQPNQNLFSYHFENNRADRTLFLLHGTGADEYDLLPIVSNLANQYNFVSLRGNVRENGMNRFFARSAPGVFDQTSICDETAKLDSFITRWKQTHSILDRNTAFLGYSNGANMILALSFLYPKQVNVGVLLHCMLPFQPQNLNLSESRFLVSYGENDRMIPATDSIKVIDTLKQFQAQVEVVHHPGGHEVRPEELVALTRTLANNE